MTKSFTLSKNLHSVISNYSTLQSNRKWVLRISTKHLSELPNLPDSLFTDDPEARKKPSYEFALVSALKFCSSHTSISQGKKIHSLVLKSGLVSNIYIQNSLINLYVKCGRIDDAMCMFGSCSVLDSASWNILISGYVKVRRLDDAYRLFEEMPNKNCVSYTTMVMGLAQNDRFYDALEVFKEMRFAGVKPNEVTLASVISGYSRLDGICNGSMVHALALKAGLGGFVLVSTNLIHIYSVVSRLDDAERIFNEMPERNLVTWNAMLNGYSKAGYVYAARALFEKFPEKDLVSWSTMIGAFVRKDRLDEALVTFREMVCSGFRPNEVLTVDLVSACGRSMNFTGGQQLHCVSIKIGLDCYVFMQATIIHFYAACRKMELAHLQFESGCKENISSWNALIAGFVTNGMVDLAREAFDSMPERDVVSCSTMISGYAQIGQSELAFEIFQEMLTSGVQPNEITMVSILSAIANSGSLEHGIWVHDYMLSKSIPLNDNLTAGLIDMYAKCGSIKKALELFNHERNRAKCVSPWNAIIFGAAVHGHPNTSLRIFLDLEKTHLKPNSITFLGVLTACCHAGLVELGESCFKRMKQIYNIDPNIKHYGCFLDLLGRAGRLEEAERTIASMPMKADVVIWGTLLAACKTHGNVEIAERAAVNLEKLEPTHGGGRVLLSNTYADAGRWEEVFVVRNAMLRQGVQKVPGCSGFS
ncbi:hypothetical protein MKW94_021122 [Papaver nudicaule]|uniref:Uncharacterized protein n=1 Tax=Papaver nudicaule TaxID=74823 RepID=A0AA41RS80_PAPNU|nr:hypothetical protein [Papaver nudicaule]